MLSKWGFHTRQGQNFYFRRHVKDPECQLTESHHSEAVEAILHPAYIFMALWLTAHKKNFTFCVFSRTVRVFGMALATRVSRSRANNLRQQRRRCNIRSTRVVLPAHTANCLHWGTASVPSNQRLKCEHPTDEHYVLSFTEENSFDWRCGSGSVTAGITLRKKIHVSCQNIGVNHRQGYDRDWLQSRLLRFVSMATDINSITDDCTCQGTLRCGRHCGVVLCRQRLPSCLEQILKPMALIFNVILLSQYPSRMVRLKGYLSK
jgi:hypothetical protein